MSVYSSIDSFRCVFGHISQLCPFSVVDHARHHTGLSCLAFFNSQDLGLVELAAVDIHECSGIAVTDPVTQSAEAAVHVNIRHRSDPLGIIPDPGAELVVTVICQDRRHVHVDFPPIPPDPEKHGFSSGRVHGIDQSVLIF